MDAKEESYFAKQRENLIASLAESPQLSDRRVLEALGNVPREKFIPQEERKHAYEDRALYITEGQTISQPYIVAIMTQVLQVEEGLKVLEIGTGTGYQTAVLVELGCRVFTIEYRRTLFESARTVLEKLGYADQVQFRQGDGRNGWAQEAPFDRCIITAAAEKVPETVEAQIKDGGRIVAPLGSDYEQQLVAMTRRGNSWHSENILPCRFVRLVEPGG